MKKTKVALFISSLALTFGVSSFIGVHNSNKVVNKVDAASYSQSVNDYYSSINWNLTGASLKTALFNKIKISTAGWSYDGLWEAYKKTDVRDDGTHFWDIYSDTTMYTLNDKRINASYKKEGDSINREHVIPQSSFKEAAPMKSDVHHVLPSDGYVNNRRSNYPHGIVTGSVKYTSNDGCKLGTGTGNTTVFEPMNQYKGDIARIYFYFVTCYENKMASNTFGGFDKSTFPSIKSEFLSVYLKWAKEDPVSKKEIDRNNAAYAGQGNRNPFIDCPYAVGAIWDSAHASDYGVKGEYTSGTGISISKQAISLVSGGTTTINATTTGGSASINWTTSNSNVVSLSSSSSSSGSNITLTAGSAGTATITARATISGTTYQKTCTVTVANSKQVSSLTVTGAKTTYNVGDDFVKPVVTAYYNDDTSADVSNSATYTGYNLSTAGTYTVTVSFSGKSTSYQVTVKSSGGGGGSGDEVTLDIDFTESKSSDTDSKGHVWSTEGDFTKGASYLRLNSSSTFISNSPALSVDTSKSMSISATLRTYGGTSGRSFVVKAYYENEIISNTLTLTPDSSTLTELSGTLTFSNSNYHDITIKAYNGSNNQIGISGMTVTYTEWNSSSKTLSDIEIQTSPKTTYQAGNTFDPTGLVITRFFDDESSDTYSYAGHESEFSFDPSLSTSLTGSNETVEITYKGETIYLPIEVSVPATLLSISIKDYIVEFDVGQQFSFGGTVTAYYDDATSQDVTSSATFSGYNMSSAGQYTITVSYENQQTSYNITVNAVVPPDPVGSYSITNNSPYINGIAYKMYFVNGSTYYYTGSFTSSGYYGNASTNYNSAIDVYFEESGNGQNLYYLSNNGNTKNYLKVIMSGTHYNFGVSTTAPDTKWIYQSTETYTAMTFDMSGTPFTFGSFSDKYEFRPTNLNAHPDNFLMDFITKDGEGVKSFAPLLNSYIKCDASGESAPKYSSYSWSLFELVYSKFSSNDKQDYENALASESGTAIEQFVARYDYIVGKYGYRDFINRNPVTILGANINVLINSSNNESILTIVVIATISTLAFVTLLAFKKRKK